MGWGARPATARAHVARGRADRRAAARAGRRVRRSPRTRRTAASSTRRGTTRCGSALAQSYLGTREAVLGSVDDLDLDDKSADRARFALMQITEAMAPTNVLRRQPGGDEAGGRHPGPVAGARRPQHGVGLAPQRRHAVAGRHPTVRGRRQPGGVARRRRLPQRRARADPVRADHADRPGAAGHDRAAADQPLLLPRPGAGPQLHRARRRAGPARSSPSRGATPRRRSATGRSTPTSAPASTRPRWRATSPAATTST